MASVFTKVIKNEEILSGILCSGVESFKVKEKPRSVSSNYSWPAVMRIHLLSLHNFTRMVVEFASFDVVESPEVTVRSVKHIEGAWILRDGIYSVEDMDYAVFPNNDHTTWHVFFNAYEIDGETVYLVRYMSNNHVLAHRLEIES